LFTIIHVAPGDPVTRFMSLETTAADLDRMRHVMGLDRPIPVQYVKWLGNLVTGDWGRSFADGQPVLHKIAERVPATLELTVVSLLVALLIAIPVGVIAATRQYSLFDYGATFTAFIGISIPGFWLGLLLMLLFAVKLRWLPAVGRGPAGGAADFLTMLKYLAMPAFVLAIESTAAFARYVRASMLEVVRQDYIRTAKAKGVADRIVIYKHALRNALLPLLTILGLALPGLVGGSAIIESLFAWPGMGRLFVQSAFNRDYTVIMGCLLLSSVLVVLGNLLADITYALVDPRIKYN
jgi:peptide/nickel transport system permease protein